jgi:hypothetical protein
MISDFLVSLSSNFDYHLRIELENPCLFDNESIDCFLYTHFFINPPAENFFIEHLPIIKQHIYTTEFKQQWYFDPYKMSYELYQTKYYAPLIMLVNNTKTILDFHPQHINSDTLKYPDKTFVENLIWEYLNR